MSLVESISSVQWYDFDHQIDEPFVESIGKRMNEPMDEPMVEQDDEMLDDEPTHEVRDERPAQIRVAVGQHRARKT